MKWRVERYEKGWVTIGSNPGAPSGSKGGTPVQLGEDGKILKGPKGLKGKSVSSIGKSKKDGQRELQDRPLFGGPQDPAEGPKTSKPDKPAPKVGASIVKFNDLDIDAGRFQYKIENIGSKGVTSEFSEVQYDPMLAGMLYVWHDPADGKSYVINGHHRAEIGKRSKFEGDVAVYYLDAKDGEEARAKGALVNIAEGHGTALDAAKFMRDAKFKTGHEGMAHFKENNISLKGKVAADALLLANLSDNIFRDVAYGRFSEGWARAIGTELAPAKDSTDSEIEALYEAQNKLAKRLAKSTKKWPDKVVREMALMASLSPTAEKGQVSLFGDEQEAEVLFEDRASVQSAVRDNLSKSLAAFGAVGVAGRAEMFEESGVGSVDTEVAEKQKSEAAELREVFDREIRFRGGIGSDLNRILNEAAEEHNRASDTAERNRIKKRAVEGVRRVLTSAANPDGSDDPGGMDEGRGGAGEEEQIGSLKPSPGQRDIFRRRGGRLGRRLGRMNLLRYVNAWTEPYAADPWTSFTGPKGGRGWTNSQTGEVVYQQEKPGVRGDGEDDQGAARAKEVEDFGTPEQAFEDPQVAEAWAGLSDEDLAQVSESGNDRQKQLAEVEQSRREGGDESEQPEPDRQEQEQQPEEESDPDIEASSAPGPDMSGVGEIAGVGDDKVPQSDNFKYAGDSKELLEKFDENDNFTDDDHRWAKQGKAMFADAAENYKGFQEVLDLGQGFSKRINAEVVRFDSAEAYEQGREVVAANPDKPFVIVGGLKGQKRAAVKVARKYKGDWSQLTDVVRATVIVGSPEDFEDAMKGVREEAESRGWKVASFEDKYEDPKGVGYRDFKVSLQSPNGHQCELQFNTHAMFAAKEVAETSAGKGGHMLYEDIRKAQESATAEGRVDERGDPQYTPEEAGLIESRIKESKQVYGRAFRESMKASPLIAGRSNEYEGVHDLPEREEGESDKQYRRKLAEALPTPKKLPDSPAKYFNMDDDTPMVATSDLNTIRARPEGIERGAKFMRMAFEGLNSKRKPIDVIVEKDGTYTVNDGNSTVNVAQQAGWKQMPVNILEDKRGGR